MKVVLNDKEVTIPSSLSEFTLGHRIRFHQEHGDILDKMLESILTIEEPTTQELELGEYAMEKMFRTFAFFAGATVEAVKESKFIDDIAHIYYSCLSALLEDEQNLQLKTEFVFKGELWELATPDVRQGDKRTFGEFIDAKQLLKDMIEMGKGKWEAMLPICAIYLRKKGEPYDESFLYENSERLQLMEELPMDIAMQVGFFLTGSMNFSISILTSSENPELKEQENTSSSILTGTAG